MNPFFRLPQCVTSMLTVITLATLLGVSPARAQRTLMNLVEPTRFALVIGNSNYAEHGNLINLGSPCSDDPTDESDSKAVAEALRFAKWQVDHVCNLTASQLHSKIQSFNRRVQLEDAAFGVIYFSGHGAQVAGTNYLFGVDANVVETEEYAIYKKNPYATLFLEAAISLDVEMRAVQPLWGKAVVVFVDACRTNPLMHQLREKGIPTIFPAVASEPENIVYSFATRAGEAAPDGGLGSISRFARFLSSVIRGDPPDSDEVDQLLSAVGTKVIIDSRRTQFTGRAGSLQRPPRFCIKGCGEPVEYWKSLNEQFGRPRPSLNSSLSGRSTLRDLQWTAQRIAAFSPPRFIRVSSTVGDPGGNSENQTSSDASSTKVADSAAAFASAPLESAAPTRAVRFDILYCAGDASAELRERKAEELRDQLLKYKGRDSLVGGFEAGEVRLLAVPPAINQSLYKASDTVLLFNRDSPAQRDWAARLQSSLATPVRIQEKPGVASDYIRILVCDGARSTPGPTVYTQAASADQLPKASLIREDLALRLPTAHIVKEVEIVDRSPNETEVRYFTDEEEADAQSIAQATSELLRKPVRARLIRGYEAKGRGYRFIEVWIGKREAP